MSFADRTAAWDRARALCGAGRRIEAWMFCARRKDMDGRLSFNEVREMGNGLRSAAEADAFARWIVRPALGSGAVTWAMLRMWSGSTPVWRRVAVASAGPRRCCRRGDARGAELARELFALIGPMATDREPVSAVAVGMALRRLAVPCRAEVLGLGLGAGPAVRAWRYRALVPVRGAGRARLARRRRA